MWKKEEIFLLSLMIIISIKTARLMSISQCAGSRINLSCGDSNWLVNIFYETYAYVANASANSCRSNFYECSDTEFMNSESSRECTGQTNCSFIVPSNRFLTSCLQNASLLIVHYDCVPKVQIYDMCTNFTHRHGYSVYLMSPGYPRNRLPVTNCECQISGRGINGTILDHVKDGNSPVIMLIITQSFTYHINSVKVLNTAIFYDASKVIVIIHNRHSEQTFKLWMGFKGNGMTVICGSGDPIKPTTVSPTVLQTTDITSSVLFPSNDFTGITSFTATDQSKSQTVPLSATSAGQTMIKSLENPTKSKFSSNIIIPSTSLSSPSSSSTSSTVTTSSIVISINNTNGKNNTSGEADYTVLYLIIGVSCLLFILLVVIIIMAVLIVREERAKHRYDQYSLEGNDNVIFAYGSFHNTSGSNEEDELDVS